MVQRQQLHGFSEISAYYTMWPFLRPTVRKCKQFTFHSQQNGAYLHLTIKVALIERKCSISVTTTLDKSENNSISCTNSLKTQYFPFIFFMAY